MQNSQQSEIADAIRDYVLQNHLKGEPEESLGLEMPLVSSGILDSLALFGLISFLEKKYKVELSAFDTSVENFNSIADMSQVVDEKMHAKK